MRKAVVLLSVALVVSLSVSLWLWGELKQVRATTSLQVTTTAVDTAPANPLSPPSAALNAPASLPATAVALADSTGSSVSTLRASDATDEWHEKQRKLLQDPRYRDAWKEMFRSNYARRRESAIRLLQFTPTQADALMELQIEQALARAEAPAVNEEDEADVRRHQELMSAIDRRYEDQARGQLGPFKYEKLQGYMESLGSRAKVDRLRNQLGEVDALRDEQVESLITALHTEDASLAKDLQQFSDTLEWEANPRDAQLRYNERNAELLAAAQKRMRASASGILNTSQLKALDAMLKRELESLLRQQAMTAIQVDQANPAD